MSDPTTDLNQVITSAVHARIEAEVLKALSTDDTFARFVTAALQQKVEDPDNRYARDKTTYLAVVLKKAIKEAARLAVEKVVAEMAPEIEAEVAKALRRDVKGIAGALVASVGKAVSSPYGLKIELREAGSDS